MRSTQLVDVDQAVETLSTAMTSLTEVDWAGVPLPLRLNVMGAMETETRRLRAVTYAAPGSLGRRAGNPRRQTA